MNEHDLLADLLGARAAPEGRVFGVVVGVVTNNKDDGGLGRVKVKFPWLSDDDESNWARVLAPMAGDQMGVYFLPEVDDEVLVVFEQGRVDRPFVLGALWNGKQKPPVTNGDGKNNVRVICSRSGHVITLDDTKDQEKITIADGKQKGSIVIDVANEAVTITSGGDLTLTAKGKITLESKNDDVVVKGGNVSVQAQQAAKIKGSPVDLNDGGLKVQ